LVNSLLLSLRDNLLLFNKPKLSISPLHVPFTQTSHIHRPGQKRHFFKGGCTVSQVTQRIMIMVNRALNLQPNKPTKHKPGPGVASSCWEEALWITGTTKQWHSFSHAHVFYSSSPVLNAPALFALIQTPQVDGRCEHVTEGSHEARCLVWVRRV